MKKVDDKSKKKKTITKKKSSKKNYSQQEQLEVKGKSVFQIVADNNDENEDIQNDQNNEQLVGE